MKCKIVSCERVSRVFEMCDKHYRRYRICNSITKTSDDHYWEERSRFRPEGTGEKIRAKMLGRKGTPHTEEHKKYMSEIKTGSNNSMWKGNGVGYKSLHMWVHRNKPKPDHCERCGSSGIKIEASNTSGKYLRDITDWEWLCDRCHHIKDEKSFDRNERGQFVRIK